MDIDQVTIEYERVDDQNGRLTLRGTSDALHRIAEFIVKLSAEDARRYPGEVPPPQMIEVNHQPVRRKHTH